MTKKQNALDTLSKVSGVSRQQVDKIWQGVKENHKKLDNCTLHQFGKIGYKPGKAYKCLNCGGEMRTSDIYMYAKGYVAAGKDKKDIYEI